MKEGSMKTMNDSTQETNNKSLFTKLSVSLAATLVLASITEAYYFGYPAFVVCFIIIIFSALVNILSQKKRGKILLVFSGVFNAWIVIYFGIFYGFWNHLAKVSLIFLHNNKMPPLFSKFFSNPQIGSFISESAAILSFVASMMAVNYMYKIMKGDDNNE
jgi:hypothetical protein